jgi:hypothetical protein
MLNRATVTVGAGYTIVNQYGVLGGPSEPGHYPLVGKRTLSSLSDSQIQVAFITFSGANFIGAVPSKRSIQTFSRGERNIFSILSSNQSLQLPPVRVLLHVAPERKCEGGDRIGHVGYFWVAPTVGVFVLSFACRIFGTGHEKSSLLLVNIRFLKTLAVDVETFHHSESVVHYTVLRAKFSFCFS